MEFNIFDYVRQECIIVIPVLWILGMFFKELNFLRDNYIPFILMAVGILLSMTILGFSGAAVMQGILISGAAVGLHQFKKQFFEKGE